MSGLNLKNTTMADIKEEKAKDAKTVPAETNEAAGKVKEFMEEKGAQSKKQLSEGGKEVVLSLTNTTNVRFTKDYGKHLKKGMEQEVSDQAFAIYDKAGVIEKV